MREKLLNSLMTLLLYITVDVSNCAKILGVYPVPSISHQVVFRPVMKELARRGHDVTIITPYPENNTDIVGNYKEIDVHDVSINAWKEMFATRVIHATDVSELAGMGMVLCNDIFEMQLKTKPVKDLLNSNEKFDLVFVEALTRTALILSHVFDAPAIQFSSFYAFHPVYPAHGSVGHLLLHGEPIRTKLYNMSFLDKLKQLRIELKIRYLMWRAEETENALLKRNFGPEAPTVQELLNRAELLFLNVNPIFEGNRAVPPGVIHLGGLHQKPIKELPTDLKSFLDGSKHGVIYMSFGSNADTDQMHPEIFQVFCQVFSRLPFDVLWKWNSDELQGKPDNVRISKWLPQSDLLRHPKIKLFITQGGLQSSDEAITAGVPLLTVPLFGDQWFNAEQQVRLKIAVKIELGEITDEVLEAGIKEVIGNPSYRKNVEILRAKIIDQPQTPLERAVWWTEYVLRHKTAKHLRSPMANISWAQYLMLDVAAVVLCLLAALIFVVFKIVKCSCKVFKIKTKSKTS